MSRNSNDFEGGTGCIVGVILLFIAAPIYALNLLAEGNKNQKTVGTVILVIWVILFGLYCSCN